MLQGTLEDGRERKISSGHVVSSNLQLCEGESGERLGKGRNPYSPKVVTYYSIRRSPLPPRTCVLHTQGITCASFPSVGKFDSECILYLGVPCGTNSP